MKVNKFTVNDLEHHIKTLLLDFPVLQDDEDLRRDVLEGNTTFHEVMERLLDQAMSAKTLADAVTALIEKHIERRDKLKKRHDFYRKLMQTLLETADIQSVELPAAKISVTKVAPSLMIVDPDAIPDEFIRWKKEPDKMALKEALKNGTHVPGVTMSNGGTTIQIR